METVLQIKIEETILNDAEITAQRTGSTVVDLASKFIHHLANQKNNSTSGNEVNSYEELKLAIEIAEDDFKHGRTISELEMMNKIKQIVAEIGLPSSAMII